MKTIGGPWAGTEVDVPDGIRTVDVPYYSDVTNRFYIVHYDLTPDGLIWRDWKRAKQRHAGK